MRYVHAYSPVLESFLALQRELLGRDSWEPTLLAHPVHPDIDAFRDGFALWAPVVRTNVPRLVAQARTPEEIVALADAALRPGAEMMAAALHAAAPALTTALAGWAQGRHEATASVDAVLSGDGLSEMVDAALGISEPVRQLELYLVPFAPHPPAAGFLAEAGQLRGLYADYRRFRGSTLADSVLTLLSWERLMAGGDAPTHLSVELATRLPGRAPYQRRLRVLLTKILVEMTAGYAVRRVRPDHRPCYDVLGTRWRFPRLFAVAERYWGRYLDADLDRDEALAAIAAGLSGVSPRWYVDHVDPAALAADFYLLESMAAGGDRAAGRQLARWLPQLCADLAAHLDVAIGNELGHYDRARLDTLPPPLAEFLAAVGAGDSRAAWPAVRRRFGHARALDLAARAFDGPGAEFGGEAWAPVAAMVRRYVTRELPDRVFVDQCFTLEHNNGSLFDKHYDTEQIRTVLDAQARTDLTTLARHASADVRRRWEAHQHTVGQRYHPAWFATTTSADPMPVPRTDWFALSVRHARPGDMGCGSSAEPVEFDAYADPHVGGPVRIRRPVGRRPLPADPNRYASARAVLHTTLGEVHLILHPTQCPYTVDNFVGLATGARAWRDPLTGEPGAGGFYDGTVFHRRVPGYLVQGGDRLGNGQGSAGYRIAEEICPDRTFHEPFQLAMANLGRDSTGSQFFITVAPAPRLNGLYSIFGEVATGSRPVVLSIADSTQPVVIDAVTVACT